MATPENYTDRPSDVANALVSKIRHQLWRSVTIVKPFRKYYVYVADVADPVLPQLCSIYMVLFYLGSITRYRPNYFDDLIAGPFGAFIQEFIENQPNQLVIPIRFGIR
jgi:YaaC-like Protein